jgi:hypothetical protein
MSPPCLRLPCSIRICYFNVWAQGLEEAVSYVRRAPELDLAPLVSNPRDAGLMTKARLDCDWYAENARCFAAMSHPGIQFLPAWVCGKESVLEVARAPRQVAGEERWLIMMGHQPQSLGPVAGKVFELLARTGVRHAFYAFDEASREMPCFAEIAPHLSVLIHDEAPLDDRGRARLRREAVVRHRSWVANVVPGTHPFVAAPEARMVFLGSQLGLTPHRQRQIDFLRRQFGDRFTVIADHSLPVRERGSLAARFAVSVCPEGRKFGTPAMAATHTDRPFWSGCLGLVPVSEDSRAGGRLEELHRAGLIVRYAHGDLTALGAACERALAMGAEERRRIHEHFNRSETVGTVLAEAIAAAGRD